VSKSGNIIVKNKKKKCLWASFGCPKKALLNKLNAMSFLDGKRLAEKDARKEKKKLDAPQLGPVNVDPKKPVIHSVLPVLAKPHLPKGLPADFQKPKSRTNPEQKEKFKDLLKNGDGSKESIDEALKLAKGITHHQKVQLKKDLKSGKSYDELKEIAEKEIKKAVKHLKKRVKRHNKRALRKIKKMRRMRRGKGKKHHKKGKKHHKKHGHKKHHKKHGHKKHGHKKHGEHHLKHRHHKHGHKKNRRHHIRSQKQKISTHKQLKKSHH